MSGKTAGQLAYEALHASVARRQPRHIWVTWDAVDEINDGIPGEPLREDLEAAAAAVETEQARLAREDRDQLRKQVLDLAAELERLAGEHSQKAAEYDRDAAQENFHRGCRAALDNAADCIRKIAGPPS
jgi:hypothetical protein